MEEEMDDVWIVTVCSRNDSTCEPVPCMVFTDEAMAKSWAKEHNKDNDCLWYQASGRIFLNRQVWVEQDSWEKLQRDVMAYMKDGSVCSYTGYVGKRCGECPFQNRLEISCGAMAAEDVFCRSMKLAGVASDD